MTPTNDAPVTVEQCDREAAAKILISVEARGDALAGNIDGNGVVQAFARHRLAALASASAHSSLQKMQTASAPAGNGVFKMGDPVEKISGSSWRGKVVGTYSTSLTPEGYCVESDTETGSVQIYPAKALRLARPRAAVGEREA